MTLIDDIRFELLSGEGNSASEITHAINPLLDQLEEEMSNGGSSPSVATATITTDSGSFLGNHVFDLGEGPHTAEIEVAATTLDGDSETWGESASQVFGDTTRALRDEGSLYSYFVDSPDRIMDPDHILKELNGVLVTVGQVYRMVIPCARYLHVGLAVYSADTFALYAGSNNPVISADVTVTYR